VQPEGWDLKGGTRRLGPEGWVQKGGTWNVKAFT